MGTSESIDDSTNVLPTASPPSTANAVGENFGSVSPANPAPTLVKIPRDATPEEMERFVAEEFVCWSSYADRTKRPICSLG
ncbi:hypothetical protein NPIL_210851 [Nephila pilipes]|uniref:Uncharacterized protein n=1 Tax=Nephila pilipes TaxID=299642 RepID=A0A8X6MSH6_NEPPI|nr:hypothetical protein NPIL_210851 [Nephila pilipes]